uniref:Signal peptide peptidase SppA n=1 Tax=Candidatus Kentrum sp. LFY TaxID=2126342 RepID=A0A450W6Y8_9GAMM|nr:MAG: signal peptide peptidase SppA [Candidatus Kentron sp. LFY]
MPNWQLHIAGRVFNTPLLIHPARFEAIIAGLGNIWGLDIPKTPSPETPGAYAGSTGEYKSPGYRVTDSGVAVIDIFGVLAHRGGITADCTYILGYNTIDQRLEAAIADPDVSAIVLDIDSPGGEVSGAFELANRIRTLKEQKPIYAIADAMAASSAYLIASAATEISVTSTGYTGSIGVVYRHADLSRALDKEGISITYVFAGDHKIDGNPAQPLPDDVRADIQTEIDTLYGMFVQAVAANRGIPEQTVRDTQARVYMGKAGEEIGLIDHMETTDQLIARLSNPSFGASSRQSMSTQRGSAMSERNQKLKDRVDPGEDAMASNTDHDKKALDAARLEGERQGRTAEQERIKAILAHDAAKGREQLAHHMAFETDMDSEAVIGILEKSPVGATDSNGLSAAMAKTKQPNVGLDSTQAGVDEQEHRSLVSEIAAGATKQ